MSEGEGAAKARRSPPAAEAQPTAAEGADAEGGKGWGVAMHSYLRRPAGLLFAHPAVLDTTNEAQAADDEGAAAGGDAGAADAADAAGASMDDVADAGDGHIGGVRGMPKVGLLKLWHNREQIWSTVAERAAAAKRGVGEGWRGGAGGGSNAPSTGQQAAQRVQLKNPLRFLGRDEWLSLIPLQVMVQHVGKDAPAGMYEVVAEGAFELWTGGSRQGILTVGDWQCRIFGERGAPLYERLVLFYQLHCPDKADTARDDAQRFGAGREAELNTLLFATYGADLTSVPGHGSGTCGWIRASVKRVAPLIFVIRGAVPVDGAAADGAATREGGSGDLAYALTFPPPYAKRTRFVQELEFVLGRACVYSNEVPDALLRSSLAPVADEGAGASSSPCAAQPLTQGLTGFDLDYAETSVPEKRGPLRRGQDGRAYYGSKIEAGGHQLSTGLRDGSVWVSGKMVEGSQRFGAWIGPAVRCGGGWGEVVEGGGIAGGVGMNTSVRRCGVEGALVYAAEGRVSDTRMCRRPRRQSSTRALRPGCRWRKPGLARCLRDRRWMQQGACEIGGGCSKVLAR